MAPYPEVLDSVNRRLVFEPPNFIFQKLVKNFIFQKLVKRQRGIYMMDQQAYAISRMVGVIAGMTYCVVLGGLLLVHLQDNPLTIGPPCV